MKRRFVLLSLCLFVYSVSFSQKRFIGVDNTKIWINTIGTESRQEGVSELAPLATYDRPGIGDSEPDHEMPAIKNVADKLIKILKELNLAPPYILVGHSLGGAYVRGCCILPDDACRTGHHRSCRFYRNPAKQASLFDSHTEYIVSFIIKAYI